MVRREEPCGVSTHSRPKAAGSDTSTLNQHGEFQHTAARRRLAGQIHQQPRMARFNTQPPEGGWRAPKPMCGGWSSFNTQPPEGGWVETPNTSKPVLVSTHSRPKAAGSILMLSSARTRCFNTQPPEGGWFGGGRGLPRAGGFNTQPPEGGWAIIGTAPSGAVNVSTHSRPKAAGFRTLRK